LSLRLLDSTALFHIDVIGFHKDLEVSLSLDSFRGRSHMDEECLARTGVPDKSLEPYTFANLHLEMVVLEGRDSLLNTVFLGDIENWRAFV
jgi:hypothetical protein